MRSIFRSKNIAFGVLIAISALLLFSSSANAFFDPDKNQRSQNLPQQTSASMSKDNGPQYVPNEVIIKLKDNADLATFYSQTYAVRSVSDADKLSRLKSRHGLRDESPVFKELHNELKANNLSQVQLDDKIHARLAATKMKTAGISQAPTPKKAGPDLFPIYKLNTDRDVLQTCEDLKKDSDIEYAEPNYIVKVQMVPNDPYYSSSESWGQPYDDLWGVKKIQCEQAWDTSQGEGVVVSVIDTGVDYNHEDLAQNIWVNEAELNGQPGVDDDNNGYIDDIRGWDFAYQDNDPMDGYGHGTHCSGTIAAVGNNNIGVIGVAPKAKIMAVKGLDDNGSGTISGLAPCIIYAADNGAKVLSNSWGGNGTSQVLTDAFHYAHSKGCICVAAAGNSNADMSGFTPANIDTVIAVAATNQNDEKCDFSNYGAKIDVAAPGGDSASGDGNNIWGRNILSLRSNNNGSPTDMYGDGKCVVGDAYYRSRGTSMACPHVAGVAALILSKEPAYTGRDIKRVFYISSDDKGSPGWDAYYGYGRVNALRALQADFISYIRARITGPMQNQQFGKSLLIEGVALASVFSHYTIEVGAGENPTSWRSDGIELENGGAREVFEGDLGKWDSVSYPDGIYTIKLSVFNSANSFEEHRVRVIVYNSIRIGWPQDVNESSFNHVVMADLDNDGKQEIIETACGMMYVWRGDGTSVSGWPKYIEYGIQTPSVGDLDKDGCKEIVVGTQLGHLFILSWDGRLWTDGWPKGGGISEINYISSAATLADIDGDGDLEILVGNGSREMCAWHHTGAPVAGWPAHVMHNQSVSAPAVADIDRDGEAEIIALEGTTSGPDGIQGNLYAWNADGTPVSGNWPVNVSGGSLQPVIGDIDGDGMLEIVVNSDGGFFALKADGSIMNGWPKVSGSDWTSAVGWGHIALGDLDHDSAAEIIIAARGSLASVPTRVWVFKGDGSTFGNWPYDFEHDAENPNRSVGVYNVLVADVNSDARQEVVVPVSGCDIYGTPYLYIFKDDGTMLEGYPMQISISDYTAPALGDLDGNGVLSMACLGGWQGRLPQPFYVYDIFDTALNRNMDWPMFGRTSQHTALYKSQNHPPVINPIGNKEIDEAQLLGFTLSGYDIDGDIPVYRATDLPQGAAFVNKTFSWTPGYSQAGTYVVTFVSSDDAQTDSQTINIIVRDVAFPAPDNLIAENVSTDMLDITWRDNSDGEDGFKIERSQSAAGDFVEIAEVGANVARYRDSGLLDGITYYYRVRAYDSVEASLYSNILSVTTVLQAPTGLLAAIAAPTQINLSWQDNSPRETGYKIERGLIESGPFTQIGTTGADITAYYDSAGLTDGVTYYYRVKAYNIAVESPCSNIANAHMPLLPPSLLQAHSAPSSAEITLVWYDNADGKDGFKIERSLTDSGGFAEIAAIAASARYYIDPDLAEGTAYYYRIMAYNSTENSPYSNMAVAFTLLPAPLRLTATAVSKSQVDLTWIDRSSNELGFKIERSLNRSSGFTVVATVGPNVTSFRNNGLNANTTYYYRVRAYNAAVNSGFSETVSVRTLSNRPPVITVEPPGDKTVNEGEQLTFNVSATDPDGDPLILMTSKLPLNAFFSNGIFTWAPHYDQVSQAPYLITFTARESEVGGLSVSTTVNITVNNVNRPPVIEPIGNKAIDEGKPLEFKVTASDLDGDAIVVVASDLPMGATFSSQTNTFSWVPTYQQAGTYQVTFMVSDGDLQASETITITVNNVNRPPEFDFSDQSPLGWIKKAGGYSIIQEDSASLTMMAIDPEGDSLTMSLANNPSFVTLATYPNYPGIWFLNIAPPFGGYGTYDNITLSCWDKYHANSPTTFTFKVMVGRRPLISATGQPTGRVRAYETVTGNTGKELSFDITASSPDGLRITSWEIFTALPQGAAITPVSDNVRRFLWTPTKTQAGQYTITMRVKDENGTCAILELTLDIKYVNRPPMLDPIGNKAIDEGKPLEFKVTASDPDGDQMLLSAKPLPYGATFEGGTFKWTPGFTQAGTYTVTFKAEEARLPGLSDTETIIITVKNILIASSDLIATPYPNRRINITWRDNSSDEAGFKIERSGDGISFVEVATVPANTTTRAFFQLKANTAYYFRVRAYNAAGYSGYSNIAFASTVIPAPTNLTAAAGSQNQINLKWQNNYKYTVFCYIERSLNASGPFQQIARIWPDKTTYTYTVTQPKTYYYRVRASSAYIEYSGYSNVAKATIGR